MGFNKTVWCNPRDGAINLIGQYEYLTRNPWYLRVGSETGHDSTIFFDVRHTLLAACRSPKEQKELSNVVTNVRSHDSHRR